ncbi:unnamed protein product [Allacma fusca]|uniref:Uncharacterized protein n=1 Tax=Allacma fusca TaxID=39272 RepID=A0A8J2JRA5_9HEXA|nr:unnamed protein product [Allacma fusca]
MSGIRPDLVVGAPFYVDSRGAGGAAYVYLNTAEGFPEDTPYVRLTGPSESRFGYAISTIGDLNKDGFDDLAVGAPYAEQGTGHVYIYLGDRDGVIREPSQIIKASAYESDMVVLLRSRPIIDIHTEVFGNLSAIDPSGKGCEEDPLSEEVCFSFEACFEIREVAQVRSVSFDVESRIEAETFVEGKKYSRVKFRNGLPERPQVVKNVVNVKQNQAAKHCSKEIVYLKKGERDIQSPIAFKLTFTLIQSEPRYRANVPELPRIENYPILNQQEASKVFVARFEKDCKSDLCESDLFVSLFTDLVQDEANNYQVILGLKQELVLTVNVQNFGEPAYEAMLYLSHPKSMSYIAAETQSASEFIGCSPLPASDLVICPLGNPYKSTSLLQLKVRFASSNLKDIETRLDFDIWVNSTSFEQDEQNNRDHVTATVIKRAELQIFGRSEPGNVYYGGKITGESAIHSYAEIGPRVVHEYVVINDGPWKASRFDVDIWWPHQVENKKAQGKWLLYPESVPSVDGDVTCTVPPNFIDVLHLRTKRSADAEDEEDEWVVAPQKETGADGKTKTYVLMDCTRGSAKCFKIECVIKNLLAKESAVIKIHSRLWNATLVEEYSQVDEVRIRSKAQIRISDDIRQDPVNDNATAVTTCYPDLKLKVDLDGIAWWIYALAIIVGILVLALIVFCLYRSGFFKRRRPEPTHTASVVKS